MCKHPTCNGGECRRVKKVKKIYKIKPVGTKQRKRNTIYSQKANAFKKLFPICQANVEGACTYKTTDIHHKKGRVGDNYLDESTWLAVCRDCHSLIELNPEWAKQMGYSENRID